MPISIVSRQLLTYLDWPQVLGTGRLTHEDHLACRHFNDGVQEIKVLEEPPSQRLQTARRCRVSRKKRGGITQRLFCVPHCHSAEDQDQHPTRANALQDVRKSNNQKVPTLIYTIQRMYHSQGSFRVRFPIQQLGHRGIAGDDVGTYFESTDSICSLFCTHSIPDHA